MQTQVTIQSVKPVVSIFVSAAFPRFTRRGKTQWVRSSHYYDTPAEAVEGSRRLANNGSASARNFKAFIQVNGLVARPAHNLSGEPITAPVSSACFNLPMFKRYSAPTWLQAAITEATA